MRHSAPALGCAAARAAARRRPGAGRALSLLSGCSVYDAPLPGGADAGDNPMTVKVDVPRRARPRARSRRSRSTTSPSARSRRSSSRATSPRSPSLLPRRHRAARTTPAPRSGRPACSARSSSRSSEPTRARHRQAGEQRRDRARPHRPQPRGRRGPRRAVAAAQRRRRRPAQDHLSRSSTTRSRAARTRCARCSTQIRTLHGPARREQGSHRRARSRTLNRLAIELQQQDGTIKSALDDIPDALRSVNRQRDDLVKLLQALDRPQRGRRPRDPGLQGVHDQQPARPGAGARRASPRPGRTSRSPSRCS